MIVVPVISFPPFNVRRGDIAFRWHNTNFPRSPKGRHIVSKNVAAMSPKRRKDVSIVYYKFCLRNLLETWRRSHRDVLGCRGDVLETKITTWKSPEEYKHV